MRNYFARKDLLTPPIQRAAYSDRMAYILCEISKLAYFPFEQNDTKVIQEAVDEINKNKSKDNPEDIEKRLTQLIDRVELTRDDNREKLKQNLLAGDFELLETFNKKATQGFICKKQCKDKPYLVLAFRGSEKKVCDWLINANAMPHGEDGYQVHSGFYNAFKLVKRDIETALQDERCKRDDGTLLPIYITGHSLGGALAVLATKYLAKDAEGACYTFGSPRVANYEFFFDIKTPIYRIVNSSDLVPRVPLGAGTQVPLMLVKLLAWLSTTIKPLHFCFCFLEKQLDKLNGYRHYGDLRYLTDVQGGRFHEVRLVYNPPWADRLRWFLKHIGESSFLFPVKEHNLKLYQQKLVEIAKQRQQPCSHENDDTHWSNTPDNLMHPNEP